MISIKFEGRSSIDLEKLMSDPIVVASSASSTTSKSSSLSLFDSKRRSGRLSVDSDTFITSMYSSSSLFLSLHSSSDESDTTSILTSSSSTAVSFNLSLSLTAESLLLFESIISLTDSVFNVSCLVLDLSLPFVSLVLSFCFRSSFELDFGFVFDLSCVSVFSLKSSFDPDLSFDFCLSIWSVFGFVLDFDFWLESELDFSLDFASACFGDARIDEVWIEGGDIEFGCEEALAGGNLMPSLRALGGDMLVARREFALGLGSGLSISSKSSLFIAYSGESF